MTTLTPAELAAKANRLINDLKREAWSPLASPAIDIEATALTLRENVARLAALAAAPAEPPKPADEPTPAMQQAGVRELRNPHWTGADHARACAVYRAMLMASPTVTIDGPEAARGDGGEG